MSAELATAPENTSIALIRDALANKVDPATLRELLAVRQLWEDSEARKSYNVAVSEFQRRCPIVAKDDKAFDRSYARMDRIWREIRPLLTSLGLSVTWQLCELRADGICRVEGQLRHRDGHGEKLVQDIPVPELIKGQNKAQQMGSASTYARRYALCSSLGIVTGDDFDDDGNGGAMEFVDENEAKNIADVLDACRGLDDFKEDVFWKWIGVTSKKVSDIPAARLGQVLTKLNAKLKGAR
jgi:hypothetical protein